MTETPETPPESSGPRRTPLYDNHRRAGAKLVDFAGWEMPVRYSSEIEEHRAVRNAAGLFDVSHMGEVRVRGEGAVEFLQRLTPNNVAKLKPGRAHYSALLTEEATYVDDLLVYRLAADDFLVVVNAANRAGDVEWIRSHPHPGCEVDDVSDRYALLALQGPRAVEILSRHTDADLGAVGYYRFTTGEVAGRSAILSRTGYTGEDGYELYLDPEDAPAIWDLLLESGAPDGLLPAGLGARDTLRLEAGMALYGHEIDRTTTPYEAGLGWVVKLKKGDFVGRDVLVRQKQEGVEKKLIGFEVVGRGIARQGHELHHGEERVGAVRSGSWSPTYEKAIGTAYVPPALAEEGTELEIEVRKKRLPAKVVPLPFYKRDA
jgi:aminomethyltransferase